MSKIIVKRGETEFQCDTPREAVQLQGMLIGMEEPRRIKVKEEDATYDVPAYFVHKFHFHVMLEGIRIGCLEKAGNAGWVGRAAVAMSIDNAEELGKMLLDSVAAVRAELAKRSGA